MAPLILWIAFYSKFIVKDFIFIQKLSWKLETIQRVINNDPEMDMWLCDYWRRYNPVLINVQRYLSDMTGLEKTISGKYFYVLKIYGK